MCIRDRRKASKGIAATCLPAVQTDVKLSTNQGCADEVRSAKPCVIGRVRVMRMAREHIAAVAPAPQSEAGLRAARRAAVGAQPWITAVPPGMRVALRRSTQSNGDPK